MGQDVRQWDGDVAAAAELDELRTWVVWGLGADPSTPERAAAPEQAVTQDLDEDFQPEPFGRPGNDLARTIAVENDPDWVAAPDYDQWVVLVDADEDNVDAFVQDDARARGYAAYLLQAADPDTEPMEGRLRNDAVVRRTGGERIDAGRPH